jgi:hypothetical protein
MALARAAKALSRDRQRRQTLGMAIKRRRVDGGASRYAITITVELTNAAERGLAAVSQQVRHENATLVADPPASELESRSRVISVSDAARRHGVNRRTILRWLHIDSSMIASEHPYRLDPIAVDAYASSRPRSRSAA